MADHITRNTILAALPPESLAALHPRDENHPLGQVLIKSDEIPKAIYFPHDGALVSIVRSVEDGGMVEAGVVGNEGLFHVQAAITTPAPAGNQALVQGAGTFSVVDVSTFRQVFSNDERVRDVVLSFTSSFLEQLSQNLLCNRLHVIEQRLAKWLLLVRDRVGSDDLELTHEFLSHMLGVHRPGVSIAVQALTTDGLIDHSRRLLHVRDVGGLRARSCSCYDVLARSLLDFRAAANASVWHHADSSVLTR